MGRRVYVRLSAVSVCVYFCNNWGLFASFEGSIKQGGGGGAGGHSISWSPYENMKI